MTKIWKSESVSKQFFEGLGFKIRDRDFEGRKKGSDFFIELDGCIQSVEAKWKMGKFAQLLQPQIDRINSGGLLVIVNNQELEIKTKSDIERIEPSAYRVFWKSPTKG
jgi:hypothetical protein